MVNVGMEVIAPTYTACKGNAVIAFLSKEFVDTYS